MHGRVGALRDAVGPALSVGLSGDLALLDRAEPADAWHSGLAALAPREYVAVRRARLTATPEAEAAAGRERTWLADLATAVAGTGDQIGALHALAQMLGTRTAWSRDALLPLPSAVQTSLAEIVQRRPAV